MLIKRRRKNKYLSSKNSARIKRKCEYCKIKEKIKTRSAS
jgi:hypothetical protein